MIVISNTATAQIITTGEKGRTHPLRWKKGEYVQQHTSNTAALQ